MRPDPEEIVIRAADVPRVIRIIIDNDVAALEAFLKDIREFSFEEATNRLDVADLKGWRPIHWALYLRRYDCAKLMLKPGEHFSSWLLRVDFWLFDERACV